MIQKNLKKIMSVCLALVFTFGTIFSGVISVYADEMSQEMPIDENEVVVEEQIDEDQALEIDDSKETTDEDVTIDADEDKEQADKDKVLDSKEMKEKADENKVSDDSEVSSDKVKQSSDWETEAYGNGVLLTKYVGTSKNIVVPGELDGKQVYIHSKYSGDTPFPTDAVSVKFEETNGLKVKTKSNSLSYLFDGFKQLKSIDFTGLDTSKVSDMGYMFLGCSSLTDISGLANLDTSNVLTMDAVFSGCESLTSLLPLQNWDTSRVSRMNNMFKGCSSLTDIEGLGNWNTSKLQQLHTMFYGCTSLTDISALANWNISSVKTMHSVFADCKSLTDIEPLKNWDTGSAQYMSKLFMNTAIKEVEALKDWNVSKVQNMSSMFSGCTNLQVADLEKWDTPSLTNMDDMFRDTTGLRVVNLSNFKLNNTNQLEEVFLVKNSTPLLVIAKDEKLKSYDYSADNRTANGPTFDANGGTFADGSTEKKAGVFVIENTSDDLLEQIIEEAINDMEIPVKNGWIFNEWRLTGTDTRSANDLLTIPDKLNKVYNASWKMNAGIINEIPTINATDKVLTVGDTFNPLDGVTATDKEDGEIKLTENNVIANDVNMSEAGSYTVTYKVTDSQGASSTKTINVMVKEKQTDNKPDSKPDNNTNTNTPDGNNKKPQVNKDVKKPQANKNVQKSQTNDSVKTGDDTNVIALLGMALLSFSVLIGFVIRKRLNKR